MVIYVCVALPCQLFVTRDPHPVCLCSRVHSGAHCGAHCDFLGCSRIFPPAATVDFQQGLYSDANLLPFGSFSCRMWYLCGKALEIFGFGGFSLLEHPPLFYGCDHPIKARVSLHTVIQKPRLKQEAAMLVVWNGLLLRNGFNSRLSCLCRFLCNQ